MRMRENIWRGLFLLVLETNILMVMMMVFLLQMNILVIMTMILLLLRTKVVMM